ncbi:hypothetical protein Pelo_7706 [Pelomyxa schiedti]|nr:hypothetical protein Pelo_7706 [Pelomyxa schiedti]
MKVIVGLALLAAVACAMDCTYTTKGSDGEELKFDLSPITHASGEEDYIFTDSVYNTFFVNICGPTTAACKNSQAVCQQGTNKALYGCGALDNQKFSDGEHSPYEGVTVWYGNGTQCSSVARQTTIHIDCSLSADPAYIYAATEISCAYELWMKSKYACPL